MMHALPQRGFTLLIAVILASVALSLGLTLLDIAYKQVVLASSAKQSQSAFYNADSVLECALYWDQKFDTFGHTKTSGTVTCNGLAAATVSFYQSETPRRRTFTLACSTGGTAGTATITKASDGHTAIYASGFNVCDQNHPRLIERAMKVTY